MPAQNTSANHLQVQPNYDRAIRKLSVGMAFLMIALISSISGHLLRWWIIFPAVVLISKGFGFLAQARKIRRQNLASPAPSQHINAAAQASPASYVDFRARQTGELVSPSVTENTTRLLDGQ